MTYFEDCKRALDAYDAEIEWWKENVRPRCTTHEHVREFSWWEFAKRSWKMVERCPKCRGYYTKLGFPPAPKNMLDKMLTVYLPI